MPFQNIISECPPVECGLIFHIHNEPVPVPLKNVSIKTKIVDFVAEVTIEQKYVNQEANPIEAIYMFPVEEEAAVVDFTAEVDGRTIKTEVRKKEEAKAAYDKAMQDHQTAVLLEETTPDIFRIKVGQLKPGAGAKITIVYISELPVEDKAIRLTVPTTIAPRYVPPTDDSEAAKLIKAIPYSLNSPAPLSFELEVLSQSSIKSIKSPSHTLTTELANNADEKGHFSAKSHLAAKTSDLDRDLVILIESSDPHKPIVFVEKSEDPLIAGMVSLVPSFNLKDQKTEMIFLVDRSGSMGPGYDYGTNEQTGGSIGAAKKALGLFLHSLPADCYFNIFSFGSRFDSLFETSMKYDDNTLLKAKEHVQSMEANYGGTDIYEPLGAIFEQSNKPGYLRQIFVLTDGEVSNSASVVELVKRNSSQGRVFALGLGASASRHLVKGIARSGGGTAVFAADGEDLRPKVMTQLKNAMQPSISEVVVSWEGVIDDSDSNVAENPELEKSKTLLGFMKPKKTEKSGAKKVLSLNGQAPIRIPPIYDGTRLLVYRLFAAKDQALPTKVKITAQTPDGPLSVDLPIEKSCFLDGNFVHQLAARKRIQDLVETVQVEEEKGGVSKEEVEKAVVELGIKYRLASKHTSFVGIDDKAAKGDFELAMNTRDIKNQVPSGFGIHGMPMRCMASPPMPMLGAARGGGMMLCSMKMAAPMAAYMIADGPEDLSMDCISTDSPVMAVQEKVVVQEEDKLTSLIDLQSSDGHFKWGEVITRCTGKSKDELTSKRPSFVADDDIWLTAVVVALLEAMTDEKDLWELVVQKARKYLSSNLKEDEVEKTIESALQI